MFYAQIFENKCNKNKEINSLIKIIRGRRRIRSLRRSYWFYLIHFGLYLLQQYCLHCKTQIGYTKVLIKINDESGKIHTCELLEDQT